MRSDVAGAREPNSHEACQRAPLEAAPKKHTSARGRLRLHGLSIVLTFLFLVFIIGQAVSGLYQYNTERRERGQPSVTIGDYLKTGHFIEATAENWESEFLQMAAYVLLTIRLFQKGSAESKQL